MKKLGIVLIILFLISCLSGCSQKAIYSSEGLTIYRVETDQGQELYADMSIYPAKLSDDTKEFLTSGEPFVEYEVELSDGSFYGYQGMENEEAHAYAYTYGTLSDIADSHHLNLLATEMATYPEGDRNFILIYDNNSRTRNVSIWGVKPKLEKNYQISYMNIYLCFGPETDRARYSLQNITDEANYETYKFVNGEQAHLMYDLSIGKGVVFVRMEGAFYVWELEGIDSQDDLYEFADSIHWIKNVE